MRAFQRSRRSAGVSVPLFSLRSMKSWGIGELGDVPCVTTWLRSAHQSILQLLPLNELAPEEHSPYSPLSAMAIDPQYISLRLLEDFLNGGSESLGWRDDIAAIDNAERIEYSAVRHLKRRALKAAFAFFYDSEWSCHSRRAAALGRYVEAESWWLDDYSLYRAIRAGAAEQPWTAWEPSLRDRDRDALAAARAELSREILFYQYQQWVAEEQWQAAKREVPEVTILGDFPFMVALDSADVWCRQREFMLDASVGTPPDAFSKTGQNWGLPPYRWNDLEDPEWLRLRARRTAALYDGVRVDHLVGFYRTFVRPNDGRSPFFLPAEETDQRDQGERLLGILTATGIRIVVEDLGVIPDFVRASIARLGLPGYRVLRWEREHQHEGQAFIDPADYPPLSVATTGTHDTEPLAVWWESLSPADRRRLGGVPSLGAAHPEGSEGFTMPFFDARIRDAILQALYASGSDILVLPIQDIFGWRDRINQPATVGESNWMFVLPWPVDRLSSEHEPVERAEALRVWSGRTGRWA